MKPLTHLLLTGNINSFTPKVVLNEILLLNNIKDIEQLRSKKVVTIGEDLKESDLKYIATFINPFSNWTQKNLLRAWMFIQCFMSDKVTVKFNLDNIGIPKEENPFSLSNCMLFRICREWSIFTDQNTSTQDMINYITLSIEISSYDSDVKLMRNFLFTKLKGEKALSRDNLKEDILVAIDIDKDPENNVEAVARFACIEKMDISYARIPFIDYYYYYHASKFADPKLRKIYERDKTVIDLNRSFNPLFPPIYYDRRKMRIMLKKKGYTRMIQAEEIYSQLEIDFLTDNFQIGWLPLEKEDCTAIEKIPLDEIFVDEKPILSYGNGYDGYYYYTFNELIQIYQNYRSFVVPCKVDELLLPDSISRLLFFSRNNKELSDVLNVISAQNVQYDEETKELSLWFSGLPQEDKDYISLILTNLIEASMYMRGWKGTGDSYPLKKRFTSDEEKMEANIKSRIEFLGQEYHQKELAKKILSLPLYKYSYYSWKRSHDKHDGLTIWERIEIVAMGEGQRNISSCYKLSSNYLASSGYRYTIVFGMKEPFRIDKLEQIAD